jgi:WD40 repeat protein
MGVYPDALLFSPDGQLLLSFSGKHSVITWTLNAALETTMDDNSYSGHFALYQSTSGTPFWPDLAEQTLERLSSVVCY